MKKLFHMLVTASVADKNFICKPKGKATLCPIKYNSGIFLDLITSIPMFAVIIKTSQLNVISTYLNLNLAFSDISFQILGIILYLYLVANRTSYNFKTIFNVIRHFTFIIYMFRSIHISYDRYQHVRNPTLYARK